ncbi:DNA-methyltransferase [Microbulbifer thermotolerans]|uniref:DNA-methyltransferase n=1 Tax=Microbulbifer thermotolerans TaxID=252514 RepID=UPI00224B71B1|nr:site-specific DNA-methyltransferase [Microbulbifer thermotolerans]MCX2834465.1 site-specific DNA-methyltransferase [Microbulbifer thermotolerans]
MEFKKFSIGNVTLYQGDALAVLSSLTEQSIGAVITDPPYASSGASALTKAIAPSKKYVQSGQKKSYPEFQGENRDQRSFCFWSTLWASECYRIAKDGAPICVFSDWRQLPTTTDYLQAGGFTFNGIVPWDKTESTRPAKGRFRAQAEYIVWGFKGRCVTEKNPVYLAGSVRARVNPKEKLHMTGKPIAVMDHIIKIVPPGETVIDPFMGSGSTGVSAINAGLSFTGIEASPEYFALAKERLIEAYKAYTEEGA